MLRLAPRRSLLTLLGLFASFVAYRAIFVYRIDPARCDSSLISNRDAVPVALTQQAPPRELVVATYNIAGHNALRNPRYLERIADAIDALHADAIGLQEVHRGTWQARFADQVAELSQLTALRAHLGPSFRALGGEFGNAVLTRGEIEGAEVLALPRLGEPRSVLHARLRIDGLPLDLLVTHLTAWGEINRWIRRRQCNCLSDVLRGAPASAVLLGDFNATPSSSEMASLRALGLDATSEATHAWTGRALDTVVPGRGWRLQSRTVVRIGPSDHWPVVARLRWVGEADVVQQARK
jgi:endonuclease/exonuclease/phosphatase family metal-dependent hydrolase